MCQKGELPCPQIRHLMRSGCTGGRRQRIESLRERSNGRGGRDRGRALLIGQAGRRVGERGGRARLPARLALQRACGRSVLPHGRAPWAIVTKCHLVGPLLGLPLAEERRALNAPPVLSKLCVRLDLRAQHGLQVGAPPGDAGAHVARGVPYVRQRGQLAGRRPSACARICQEAVLFCSRVAQQCGHLHGEQQGAEVPAGEARSPTQPPFRVTESVARTCAAAQHKLWTATPRARRTCTPHQLPLCEAGGCLRACNRPAATWQRLNSQARSSRLMPPLLG